MQIASLDLIDLLALAIQAKLLKSLIQQASKQTNKQGVMLGSTGCCATHTINLIALITSYQAEQSERNHEHLIQFVSYYSWPNLTSSREPSRLQTNRLYFALFRLESFCPIEVFALCIDYFAR